MGAMTWNADITYCGPWGLNPNVSLSQVQVQLQISLGEATCILQTSTKTQQAVDSRHADSNEQTVTMRIPRVCQFPGKTPAGCPASLQGEDPRFFLE